MLRINSESGKFTECSLLKGTAPKSDAANILPVNNYVQLTVAKPKIIESILNEPHLPAEQRDMAA